MLPAVPALLHRQVSETEGVLTRTYYSSAHRKAAQKVRASSSIGPCAAAQLARPALHALGRA